MLKVEILGMGCPKCAKTKRLVEKALSELHLEACIVHVTDPNQIAEYGVWATPGLVVDGQVKCTGKVPSVEALKQLFGGPIG